MPVVISLLLLGSNADLLARASEAFEEALAQRRAGENARRRFLAAAAMYEAVTPRGPAAWRAIGNCRRLAGDLPNAILAYRLGLRLDPWNESLRRCLESAREAVNYDGDLGRPYDEGPLAWPTWLRFTLAALAWLGCCACLTRWAMVRDRVWLGAAALLATLTLLLGGWWASEAARPTYPLAVVTRDGTLLRRGDGELFASRYPNTLNRGVEAVVYRSRGEWRLIGVGGGIGWVPASSLAEEE
jgi:tetratricopeptide (TPR) repeat protein